jgi:hypothetical protein
MIACHRTICIAGGGVTSMYATDKSHFIICGRRKKRTIMFFSGPRLWAAGVDVDRVDDRRGVNVSRATSNCRVLGRARASIIRIISGTPINLTTRVRAHRDWGCVIPISTRRCV